MTKNKLLPPLVYQMCVLGGLLVGSAAKQMVEKNIEVANDYDILVPLEKWQTIALLIPMEAKPNRFGGWRFSDHQKNEIDIWPGTLQEYLQNCKTKYGGAVYAIDYIHNKVYSSKVMDI